MGKIVTIVLMYMISFSALADTRSFTGDLLIGSTNLEVNGDEGDDTSFGARLTYNMNANVGLEFSHQLYGEVVWTHSNSVTERTTYESSNLGFKGVLPLQNGFSLNARLGIAFWDVDVDIENVPFSGITLSGSDSGNDIYYGVGAQYTYKYQFVFGLEYTVSEFGVSLDDQLDGVDADLEVDTLALSAGILF